MHRPLGEIGRINDEAIDATVEKVKEGLWNLEYKTIALLGLAFKPDTDDVGFAPALAVARRLISEGAHVVGCDPQASATAKEELPGLDIAPDAYEAARGAHCLVVCTEWAEFSILDLDRLRGAMAFPMVVDGRNMLDPASMAAAGFSYYPTGRPQMWVSRRGSPESAEEIQSMQVLTESLIPSEERADGRSG